MRRQTCVGELMSNHSAPLDRTIGRGGGGLNFLP